MDHRPIKANRLKRQRDRLLDVLGRLDDRAIDVIERRSRLTNVPDGFSTNTRYGPREGPGPRHEAHCATNEIGEALACSCGADGGEEVTTSTERAALRLVEGSVPTDPQQRACERIDDAFQAMWNSIIAAERSWDVILHASSGIRDFAYHSPTGVCQACLRDDVPNVGADRIVAGYCPACFKAWQRTDDGGGRQDRATFERERRQLRVVKTGYVPDELDELRANGTLPPHPQHARPEGDVG